MCFSSEDQKKNIIHTVSVALVVHLRGAFNLSCSLEPPLQLSRRSKTASKVPTASVIEELAGTAVSLVSSVRAVVQRVTYTLNRDERVVTALKLLCGFHCGGRYQNVSELRQIRHKKKQKNNQAKGRKRLLRIHRYRYRHSFT